MNNETQLPHTLCRRMRKARGWCEHIGDCKYGWFARFRSRSDWTARVRVDVESITILWSILIDLCWATRAIRANDWFLWNIE